MDTSKKSDKSEEAVEVKPQRYITNNYYFFQKTAYVAGIFAITIFAMNMTNCVWWIFFSLLSILGL